MSHRWLAPRGEANSHTKLIWICLHHPLKRGRRVMVRRERAVDPPPTIIPTLRIADTAIGIHVKPARKFDAWRDGLPARRDPLG